MSLPTTQYSEKIFIDFILDWLEINAPILTNQQMLIRREIIEYLHTYWKNNELLIQSNLDDFYKLIKHAEEDGMIAQHQIGFLYVGFLFLPCNNTLWIQRSDYTAMSAHNLNSCLLIDIFKIISEYRYLFNKFLLFHNYDFDDNNLRLCKNSGDMIYNKLKFIDGNFIGLFQKLFFPLRYDEYLDDFELLECQKVLKDFYTYSIEHHNIKDYDSKITQLICQKITFNKDEWVQFINNRIHIDELKFYSYLTCFNKSLTKNTFK